jgi:hypothetical protein
MKRPMSAPVVIGASDTRAERPADQMPEYRGHSSPNIRKHRFIFVMEELRQGADLFREAIVAVAAERPAPLLGVLQLARPERLNARGTCHPGRGLELVDGDYGVGRCFEPVER